MSIWVRIGEFVTSVASNAITGVIEAVRTVFEGDADTRRRVAFSIAMIALSAKMAKADGIVTQDEIRAFQDIFAVPKEETAHVARLYDLAKQDVAGYESYARQLAGLCSEGQSDCHLLEDILDGLFHIATADGYVHEKEMAFLAGVAEIFGYDEVAFDRIAIRHVQRGADDPYAILGLERGVSFDMARKRYRALVKEHHPDRLVAEGLPLEFITIANRRLAAINAAWASIEKNLEAA
ncbi:MULTISPECIES: J domain-containing protein [Brucella/Ochrobactrum group]|jgi:DnaJ like chaperone protein|uniref:DnaJ family molecular chaperone n=1 Tax=Brucella pseudintermedia TaxID=370111 RepID=A0ABY5UCS0_9HYPH|nr:MULTISPECIES: DnaJ family molecular chaperone [Brucella/Ochrobactrum group]KAB2685294.1 DnaJ family molecular chaperone [Brucella pseudintermedia]NKE76844.1 DnaJ family molecular chaperone [Ochrobactrum sp. MC-1LL]TWG98808.1 DnaJ like chaperone protein [Ochrobactrum sp. J50]UWL61103.1 DnaJ family molecular chaperone [Brucella pseudintermedia]WPM79300.1 DnaJ family molecular chaperone [Brucella pseudintermedia]